MRSEQLMYPLVFTSRLGQVDVYASVEGALGVDLSRSARAAAIRHAVAKCLAPLLPADFTEKMRIGTHSRSHSH